jgi:glycosyltransferase involved in cell wall biosynthesis
MISIIIPVYNSEKYICQCLDSILNQKFKNYEVIIVDDGSTDKSRILIDKYLQFENFHYYYKNNSGPAKTRNYGIKLSNGDYLMFVDADDYIESDCLDLIAEKIADFRPDILIFGHYKFFNNSAIKSKSYKITNDDKLADSKFVLSEIVSFRLKGYPWDKVIKKSLWIDNNLEFDEECRYCEDWLAVTQAITLSKEIYLFKKPLYFYRQHNESLIHNSNIYVMRDYDTAAKKIVNFLYKLKQNKNLINTFIINAKLDMMHETYINLKPSENLYTNFTNNNFCNWKIKNTEIIRNKYLSLYKKLSLVFWKVKIYKIIKDCINFFKT